jgi:hypothetical protein
MFQSAPDGNFEAYDAKTGDRLWQFQIGAAGGPPLSYEIDGEQYIAAIAPAGVWAFKLGGTVAQASAPVRPPQEPFPGQVTDTTQVETASLVRDTASHMAQQRVDGPHHRGAGRLVDDRTAPSCGRRWRHVR